MKRNWSFGLGRLGGFLEINLMDWGLGAYVSHQGDAVAFDVTVLCFDLFVWVDLLGGEAA